MPLRVDRLILTINSSWISDTLVNPRGMKFWADHRTMSGFDNMAIDFEI